MKAPAGIILLLVNVHLSRTCREDGQTLFCVDIPPDFRPGYSTLLIFAEDVGVINSTVFLSDHLSSISRLRIEDAGVTAIAEGAFISFQNLENVSFNQNLLTEINPKWFGRPDVLCELSLTENRIEGLNESSLHGLSNLKRLSLSKNWVREIDLNSFSSNTILAELDLSENRMTRVSPQVFRSLRSTRIRLDGNPWDCSCGAEGFVDFLNELQSRSLLVRPMEVTCESPPSLRGQPVWNVSVCMTSPPSGPTVETENSVQHKPTDAPTELSSHTATPPSQTETSVQPKPSDILTAVTTSPLTTHKFAAFVTSPSSVTEISVHPEPSELHTTVSTPTETCVTSRPSSDMSIVCTLVAVIVVLSSLLFAVCFLAVLRRRKRNRKTVMPGHPEENSSEVKENNKSSHAQSLRHSEERDINPWDSETGWRPFTVVRAKSANAILLKSSFCAPVKDEVTSQSETEVQTEDTKVGDESEKDDRVETDNLTNAVDIIKDAKQSNAQNSQHVSVNTDTVPYLSIGANQNKTSPEDFNQQSTDGSGQRSQTGKVLGRISTWPPTAAQWQVRCKMKEEEEESDVFTVWTPTSPDEVKKVLTKEKHLSDSEKKVMEGLQAAPNQAPVKKAAANQSSQPNDNEAPSFTDTKPEEAMMLQDAATLIQTQDLKLQDLKPSENPAHKNGKKNSDVAEQRADLKRAVRRAGNTSSGSKAPSGGASPDDATLLSGNEYAFLDLLHEVVQNNGRWTRERWRQIHVNKQRRHHRDAEGVQ